jgi:hypothetical protein
VSTPANDQVDPAMDAPIAGGRLRARGWLAWIPAMLLLPIYLLTAAPTITAAYGGGDGGELAAAVALGAVPHPPGYPTYLALGRAALLLPSGEVAGRLAVLSGLCVALAAAALAGTVGHIPLAAANDRAAAAILAGLILGLDRRVWEQALIAEVYAPALLFLTLLLWLGARWWRWRQARTAAAAGLVLGLGLGIQLPILAWLLGAALATRRRKPARAWLLAGAMLALGLSLYGLLVWRGQAVPLSSWGDWGSLQGALDHIGAREYRYLAGAVPWGDRLGRLGYAGRDLLAGLGPLGAPLALVGLLGATGDGIGRWRRLSAGLGLGTLGWAISYGGADGTVYLLPLHLLGALWAGIGAQVALRALRRRRPGLVRWTLLAPALLLGLAAWQAPAISLRGATGLREAALATLRRAPPDAILVSADDRPTFALGYAQQVLGARPDVAVIDSRLWERGWYRRRLPCAGPTSAGLADCRRPLVVLPPGDLAGP